MRTNIEIDDKLIEEARRITGLSTKKAIVERALEELVRREREREVAERAGEGLVRRNPDPEVADYFGKLPSWEGDLDAMRRDRDVD
jgi:Arc/MetJ family transcription regulator